MTVKRKRCPTCEGTGTQLALAGYAIRIPCEHCGGLGLVPRKVLSMAS